MQTQQPLRRSRSAMLLVSASVLAMIASGCASSGASKKDAALISPPKLTSRPPGTPLPEAGPQPSSLAPTGSLWAASSGSLYSDLRASKVGDVVTITISEEAKASKAASTSTSREKTMSGNFTFAGAGLNASGVANPKGAAAFGPYSGTFANGFTGAGATSKQDSLTAYMSATVTDVLPNGNLVIRGSRWTKVNDEMQQMILEGVVRPADISRTNTVLSQNVAEAKIFMVGKGPVTQHQKPGWLGQLFDVISPF
ncbi:MAG: flagellar basal body L-ring protein FlgH [Desulfobacteraceae bacterium]|nr:flagellar basal body L-ring protein FlgH [Desulfobacteraceae bacterium]